MNTTSNSLLSVASHALGRIDKTSLPMLQAQPPKPALWKRKQLYPYFGFGVLVIGLLGFEAVMRLDTYFSRQQLAELEEQYSERMKLKQAAVKQLTASTQLVGQVEQKEAKAAELRTQVGALQHLLDRQRLTLNLLQTLQRSTTDEVVIESLVQQVSDSRQFYLNGWAISNTAAQLLVNNLGRDLKGWDFVVQDSRIQSGTSHLGVSGYQVEAWLRWQQEERL